MSNGEIKEYGSIVEKSVLLRINFRKMGTSKQVPSSVINASIHSKLLKIQKTLFESSEFDAITKADNQMRQSLKALCLPYDLGLDLLPRALVSHAYDLMSAYKDERGELVNAFVNAYPSHVEIAKSKMQAFALELGIDWSLLFNSNDYPSIDTVRSKFSFDWDFLSLSVPDALKLAGKYEEESAKLEAKIANVSDEITAVMRESMLELIDHLKSSLEPNADGKPKRLYGTAVTNIQDFLDTFKARNITNDAELEALVNEVSLVIHPNVNADMLKKDEHFKSTVHDAMGDIASKLSALVEVTPGRKFREAKNTPPVVAPPDESSE